MGDGPSNSDDDDDYHNAFAALDDLRLSSLKTFFKEYCLRDETLFLMQSEAELKEILVKDLGLPFGHGFGFSRLWFQKYHNNKEATSHEGLPKSDIRKTVELSERKEENEPSQVITPPNDGFGSCRREGNQNHTDSTKREMKLFLEENDVKEMKATAMPMTSSGGSDKQSEKADTLNARDDLQRVSITEPNHIKERAGLKEISSTAQQVICSTSSGPFDASLVLQPRMHDRHTTKQTPSKQSKKQISKHTDNERSKQAGLESRTVGVAGTVENDIGLPEMFPQTHGESVPAKLHLAEVVSSEAPVGTETAFGVRCERVNELDADQSLQISHQSLAKESNSLMVNSSIGNRTGTSSVSGKQDPGSVLIDCEVQEMSPGDECVSSVATETVVCVSDNSNGKNNKKEALSVCSVEGGKTAKERVTNLEENVEQPSNTAIIPKPKGTNDTEKKGSKGTSGTLSATTAKDGGGPPNVNENTCLEGPASMTISTPGEPDSVRTVENDIGEAEVKPQMAEKSVDQLEQAKGVTPKEDGVGKGKGIESPTATKNGYDVQCERENEADAADGQHLNYANHVKKCESMMEKFSTVDQTTNSCEGEPATIFVKEGEETATLKGNENQSTNLTPIAATKGKKKKKKKGSKGASGTLTDTEAKDSEGLNVDHSSNLEAGAVDVDVSEARTLVEMREHSVTRNVNRTKAVTTDADPSLTTKMAFEKIVEDCSEGGIQKDPAVKNERAPLQEVKTVIQKGAEAANLNKHITKADICAHTQPEDRVTNDSREVEDGKLENMYEKSTGNIPWSDRNHDCIIESSAQSVGTTGAGKPYQSVEKVPSHLGRGGIDNGPFSVSDSSKSSMPQDAGLPQISHQKGGAKRQSLSVEGNGAPSVQVSKCIGRPFGVKVAENNISYHKGSVLDAEENKEVEYKSFSSAHPSILPWKIMEKTKKFICACLNAGSKGIIYFGVGDNQEQNSKFQHGEIIGLKVENIKDDITKALQCLLDYHITSDDGPLQKGGDQNCINIHFVPVAYQGNHDSLYVVEIEVSRDWRFCKDNLFHSKTWIEKPGGNKDFTGKRGLNDLFKVKDTWDDVAVRTKGASTSVKQHEVKRQVREPLETKYMEWKTETKLGANEFGVGHNPDDSDFKMYHTIVKERLFDMNIKEYHYILVANKVPPQYRGTPHLSFLQSIPWVAVFDLFDAVSKKDGLHFICNETTDARRADVKTLDDFKNISSDWNTSKDCPLPTRGTTWILQLKQLQDEEWITCSAKDYFYRTLSAYKQYFPSGRLVIAILGLGENAVMEMSDIAESCFSILGGEIARKCVTIISESKDFSDALIKNSKAALRKQLKECSLTDISWDVLREIIKEMVGPTEFMERGATTKLPYFTGQREVLNKVIHSWHDLEVYCPEPRVSKVTEEIEKARNAFYKGTQASQINLFYNHTIERTMEQEITQKIDQAVKSLSTQSRSSERITVPYEPGSGATTLCRRILWNKRNDYRCAVVKAVTKNTDFQIDQLQRIGYNETQHNFLPPVLALLDNLSESDTRGLSERLITRETKCVIITTYPIQTTGSTVDFEMKPLRQLDENEMSHVRNILINITRDSGRRRGAEEVLEREKRFIWFGLELFGREYVKIRERLQNHIESTLAFLGDSHATHEKLLHFCCFLHFYTNGLGILPHTFTVDVLYESSLEMGDCARLPSIHDKFGGLLLEEYSESYGYHGCRPAHSLVSEVVKSRMNVEEIAVELLENADRGKAYVNKFLREQLFEILLRRKRVSNQVTFPQEDEQAEDSISPDEENEVDGIYVRTRYSPLIHDILGGENGSQRTLGLLITVCQKAREIEEKAHAWQQLARFLAYNMRFNELESTDVIHTRLYDAMNLSKRNESHLPMPETGIDAAHIAVDIAIRLQPNNSHHYSTKGVLYKMQLRDVNIVDGHTLVSSLPDVIDLGRKALTVYEQAIQKKRGLNFYSVDGKMEVIVLLLKIMKSLPCFCVTEDSSFTRYLEPGEIPQEMEKLLQKDDHKFIQNLGPDMLQLLRGLFKDIRYRQLTTCNENELRGLSTANLRACKLRQEFYEITGFDRSRLMAEQASPDRLQVAVEDILFNKKETLTSRWSNLDNEAVLSIYHLLKPVCLQGSGNSDNMLIFSRACLRLPRQDRPLVEELDKVVQAWIKRFPNSPWANFFNYMIHFPFPDGGLAATNSGTLASIEKCYEIAQKTAGLRARKSAAEYYLGNGTGLAAIVSRQEFPTLEERWMNTKTDFWRSKEVSETLVRVQGQKASRGVITYRGIQLRFDDMLYPKESRDDLWIYVGFSVAGPIAEMQCLLLTKTSKKVWKKNLQK